MKLFLNHLYPEHLNLYGDRGNILALYQRAKWRGIELVVKQVGLNEAINIDEADILFMGGGQDAQQLRVAEDLKLKAESIKLAVAQGAVMLGICGGYQLMGHYYQPHNGERLEGLSLIDAYTFAGDKRLIGNVSLVRPNGQTVVGFENHSGKTYLGQGVKPLGKVISGYGNNAEDQQEGVYQGSLYGTYLHGSLLPKNPSLTDEILLKALQKRYKEDALIKLETLSFAIETAAHQKALSIAKAS
jgi:hypothetical protein